MLNFIVENAGSIFVGAIVFTAAALALRSVIKTRRAGGCSGCSGCDVKGSCAKMKK